MDNRYRDEPDHPAFPIDDPNDKVTFRGMSLKCWMVTQITCSLIESGMTTSQTLAVTTATEMSADIFEAIHKEEDEKRAQGQEAQPQLKVMELAPSGPDESPGPEDPVEDEPRE